MEKYRPSAKTRDYKVKVTFQFDDFITSAICLLRSNSNGLDVLSTFANGNGDDWARRLNNQHTEKEFELQSYVDGLGFKFWLFQFGNIMINLPECEMLEHIIGIEIVEVKEYEY